MTTRGLHDSLWISLTELGEAGIAAPQLKHDAAATVRLFDEGVAAVETNGVLACVILSPTAWQRLQATKGSWQRLFLWALRHIDTPTLREMYASAEHALDDLPARVPNVASRDRP